MKPGTQVDQVIETMRRNGGFARFGDLYQLLDFSTWKTKTPEASVRRIVQKHEAFFKIQPGLWALTECREQVLKNLHIDGLDFANPSPDALERTEKFTHTYYQGLVVEIGNMKDLTTCVASGDQNKTYLNKRLKDIVSLTDIHPFTYTENLKRAKTFDVIWFNERRMPDAFFEVEHTTNIEHSLVKFCEFQDYFAKFFIVADEKRHKQFDEIVSKQMFKPLHGRVDFQKYEDLVTQYDYLCKLARIKTI